MSLVIDGLDVEGKFVEVFKELEGETILILAGTGGEGKELHNMFGRYRVGQRIQIADDLTLRSSGLWRIERIELSRSKSSPYRVSLALKRIEIRK